MKIKSLYISAQEKNAGTLFVAMGMMELLKRNVHRVAFFRPVIYDKKVQDGDISFIVERYGLSMAYEDCYGFDVSEVEEMISQGKEKELIDTLINKFKKLEESYDFVLCEGIRRSFVTTTLSYDLNILIAKNFASPYINIINAKNRELKEVYEDMLIENEAITSAGCFHLSTFINRVDPKEYSLFEKRCQQSPYNCFLLEEVEELNLPTLLDVQETLEAQPILLQKHDHTRVVRGVKVAAMNLDNFLEHIQEDDLIVVPADRSDIILGVLGALHSSAYPNISAIVFPFSMDIHPNILKLVKGLDSFKLPIFSVAYDTFTTAKLLTKVHARLRVESERKIALALGLFHKRVDVSMIEKKIASSHHEIMTPQMFEYKLFAMAREHKKTIVLPESEDERILRAAEIILRRDVAEIILLGEEKTLQEHAMRLGLDISGAKIINPCDKHLMEEFSQLFYEMRKEKGLTLDVARDSMSHVSYFATMMVELGYADGMVSGAVHSTADTMRPALQIIKTKEGVRVVSSVFFMCMATKVLVYGDCAINQDPDADTLADIAIASAQTAELFGIPPKVAMLSYSTGESGSGADVQKVREATQKVKQKAPHLLIEGPIQYDAAINKEVAKKKLPDSKVAGEATVFIFPDLNTGNNTYKAVQRSSGAVAIGPVIQGLKKPVNDLSRGCLVADIVNTVAITAIQASQI